MRRQREEKVEDKTCEICGATGLPRWIVKCSKCGAPEHQYCKRICFSKDLKIWLCEPCKEKNVVNLQAYDSKGKTKSSWPSDTSKTNQCYGTQVMGSNKAQNERGRDSPRQANLKNERAGKVKFLSIDEVMRIERGRDRHYVPSSRPCQAKAPMSSLSPRRTSKKSEYFRMRSPENVNGDPRLGVSRPAKASSRNGSKSQQPGTKVLKDRTGETVPAQQAMRMVNKEVPMEAKPPSRDAIASSQLTKEKPVERVPPGPSPSEHLPKSSPRRHCSLSPKPVSNDAAPKADDPVFECVRNHPQFLSSHTPWTGRFKFSGSALLSEYYGAFKAYPPVQVHGRAYEFSGMIPEDFPVELIPDHQPLLDSTIFKRSPDFRDVALFFYPDVESDRSFGDFVRLLDLMKNQDYAIRGFISDDVELLIFTSKHLSVDTRWLKTDAFLWGVFHDIKDNPAPRNLSLQICPSVSAAENPSNGWIGRMDDNEAAAAGSKGDRPNSPEELERNSAILDERPAQSIPPCAEWVKLSTSAVSRGDPGPAGAGGCVHGPSGEWIVGYVINMGRCTQLRADLCGLLYGLNFVSKKGYQNVLVETDSEQAWKCLKTDPDVSDPNRSFIANCMKLVGDHFKLSHVNRERNRPAVLLANHFKDHEVGKPTEFFRPPVELAEA